jgi:putative alpha-1,2-mannosidase
VLGGDALRYDPTNEPGIHAPWLYNGLGQPWKTQETVRQIVDTAYGTGPAGLPGNDDLGTMSAWYVFAAIGMFPQTPGAPTCCSAHRSSRRRSWTGRAARTS